MKIKKRIILRLLEKYGGSVPLSVAAKELYGQEGELQQLKVIRALNAYRAQDPIFDHIRVRQKKIVIL
ncbi:MAG: hypothetical protein K6U74_08655 [Firmicutes bacterium]|nr:hypothetical protein [Bacillota bacterium]